MIGRKSLTCWNGLHHHGRALETGELSAALEELLAQPAKAAVEPSGIQEAAEQLRSLLK